MSHRVDFHRERLVEHLTEREWSQEDIAHFTHMVGHSALLSSEAALSVLEFQRATDERVQAEKDYDEVFVPRIPQEFFEDTLPTLERTDAAQLDKSMFAPDHIQRRFEETL